MTTLVCTKEYYQLSTEPFKLTPDPRFVFAHRSYRKAHAYMQHMLEQGDGFLIVTGRSGTGKTTLVENFLAGLKSGNVLTATLVSTQLEADDLLRMVAYAFGIEARGLDKATLLCKLEKFLIHRPHALLIIDEAQNLSEAALEEVRMLTNLHVKSHPLLQIFLLGHEDLQQRLHTLGMEQLHQRLMAACDLEPLNLQETRDYVLHRLGCAGWRGDPTISNAAFVLIHRFSQGLPRYISKLCERLFLHGAVEQRHRLDVNDLMTVLQEMQGELLLPLITNKVSDAGEPLPGMQKLIDSKSLPADWMVNLTTEEQAFIERNPAKTAAVPASGVIPCATGNPPAAIVPRPPASASGSVSAKRTTVDHPVAKAKAAAACPDDIYWSPGRPGKHHRNVSRGKILGYGVAVPIVLIGAYLLGAHNARQQQAPVRTESIAAKVDRAAVEATPTTSKTEVVTNNVIEAVGLLPRTQQRIGDSEAAPDTAQEAAVPALSSSGEPELIDEDAVALTEDRDTRDVSNRVTAREAQAEVVAAVAPAAEPVLDTAVPPTLANTGENAAGSAAPAGDASNIGSLVAVDHLPQKLLTSSQAMSDSNRAKAAEPLRPLSPVTGPVLSDNAADFSQPVASAVQTETTSEIESLVGTPAEESGPQVLNNEPDPTPGAGGGEAKEGMVLAAPNDPTTQLDIELQKPVVTAQQLTVDNPSQLEPLPSAEVETDAVRDAGGVSESGSAVVEESPTEPPATTDDGPVDLAVQAAEEAMDDKIEKLLLLGEQAIAKYRLRFPEERSAWHYYKQVFELDPSNQAAEYGLRQIVGRYGELASGLMEKRQYDKAQLFINRGLAVVAEDSKLLVLQREVEKRQAELLAMQERERMLELQAREARALAEAASRSPKDEPEPSGFFRKWKAQASPEQLFQTNDH